MQNSNLMEITFNYLDVLCNQTGGRSVGSEGNRKAAEYFKNELLSLGWDPETQDFNAMDWKENGARLTAGDVCFDVKASPYSNGCSVEAELAAASDIKKLESLDAEGKIILLHGDIAKEQLMPRNFVFYNPEEHQKIISLLDKSGAKAIFSATGRNSSLAGGAYPFPLIEDGDFDIPSVYMKDVDGEKLLEYVGKRVTLISESERITGTGCNVIASKGDKSADKIVLTAHIDAKKGTPGAIDNATGVAVLLLAARMLKDYNGSRQIEIVALNGEDYYAVPGQMKYIEENIDCFSRIMFNLNIDGLGYFEGDTAYSFYNLPEELQQKAVEAFGSYPGLCRGPEWPQGDHSIFVQYGRPAIAFTSKWFTDNMDSQDVTHTEKDNLSIVSPEKVVTAAAAISRFLLMI